MSMDLKSKRHCYHNRIAVTIGTIRTHSGACDVTIPVITVVIDEDD